MGLQLYICKGISLVEIEGNSKLCIQEITSGKSSRYKIDNWIGPIKDLLCKLSNYSLSHMYREANMATNCLANSGFLKSDSIIMDFDMVRWPGL